MYSFKPQSCGRHALLTGTLRSFLLMLLGLLAVSAVQAQVYNWKQAKLGGGGFVTGILFHPDQPGLMYCRTDIGGAYRWNPMNNSWTQLLDFIGFDFWPNDESSLHGVESIGLDAQNTNRLYLACGWLSSPNEIFISTNQGASFTRVTSPFQIRANNDGRGTGERFGVDPNLGSTIFYGTRSDGLWKSVNYAANWAKVNSFPVNSTANGVGISFVEFIRNSGTPGNATPVIWVGVAQGGTNLFRSTDGGATWTGVATNGVPGNHMPLRASQDGLGNMYITFCDGPGPNGISAGVVRKFDLNTLTSINVTPPTGNGGFGGVSVDRQNPNIVVATTVNRWWPMSDIYRSTNGGTNWSAVYSGTVDMSSAPYMNANGGTVIQGWMFDIKIDPYNSNRVYYVTGGGVFSSYNFTATPPSWEFRSDGIEEGVSATVGMNLACPPEGGPQLYSAFGDIGGFAHHDLDSSPPLEDVFYNPQGGNNYGVNFAEQSPNIVVRTYYSGSRGGCISYDWGKNWTIFPTKPVPMTNEGPGYVALSADASRLVWAAPSYAPFYSTNNGTTWIQSTGPATLTPGPGGQDTLVADRVNPNKFYIYSPGNGRVFVSTNGGVSYSNTTTITASWDHSIHTPFGQEGQVWIAVWDGLWRSTNSGVSFTKLSNVQAARSIGFGRTATGTGYPVAYLHGKIGGVWGVYRSENQGTNWTRINDDQHKFGGIAQVIGDPKIYGRCYIKALGIHYGDIPNYPPFTPTGVMATASNAAVRLSWINAARADSYTVKRSTTSGSGYTTIATGVTATSYLDTGVVNDTTYYYVVAATNTVGGSADSAEASATPAAPTNLRALYAFEGNAQDTSGSGNHGTANALSYVAGKVGAQAAQFNGTSSYVSIPRSVQDDFTVALWVKTTDTAGGAGAQWWSGKGLVDGEVGGGGADWGTAIVNGKFVVGIGSTGGDSTFASSVNINDGTWHHLAATRNNTNGAVAIYVDGVLRGGGTGATGSRTFPASLRIGSLQTGNNFLNGTLDDVRLYDRILTTNEIAALIATPPAAPTGLAALAGDAQVALSWNASATATNYYVKRSTTSGSGYVTIATNASLAFTNTGLVNGTTYYFVVSAVNAGGASTNSTQASATPLAPPAAPTGVVALAGDATVALSWDASATATNYYVKRSMTSGSGFTTIATNATLTFTNTGLNNGTLYYFAVSALNASGQGVNSAEVSARPTSSAPVQLGLTAAGNQLEFNWPADHTGWLLQSQTNSLAVGLDTNWGNIAGSIETNQWTLPLSGTNGAVFFRLMRP